MSNVYTSIDTDLSSVSSNHDTLVSAKAVKSQFDNIDTTLTIGADFGGTDTVSVGTDTLNFVGTTNEIETVVQNNQIQIGLPNNVTVSGNLTVNGNTSLGNATSDTITFTGRVNSDLAPSGTTRDLGTTSAKWRDLHIDGVAFVDDIHTADCDINGGQIDGVSIGTNSPVTELRVDNVQINGNTVTTTSGGLVFDSAGGTSNFNDNLIVLDGHSFFFGNSSDLQIVHDGGNSVIREQGQGELFLQSDGVIYLGRTNGSTQAAVFDTDGDCHLNHNGGERIRARSAGAKITGELEVTGDVLALTSDIRLKTNIEPINNALEKVSGLNGFTYNHNEIAGELGLDTKQRYAGVSAQELQDVLPEAVKKSPASDEYLTVQYEKVVPLLIEAIKELKSEIEELKK